MNYCDSSRHLSRREAGLLAVIDIPIQTFAPFALHDTVHSDRIDERRHNRYHLLKERLWAGIEQQRLLIAHLELAELNIKRFNKRGDTE